MLEINFLTHLNDGKWKLCTDSITSEVCGKQPGLKTEDISVLEISIFMALEVRQGSCESIFTGHVGPWQLLWGLGRKYVTKTQTPQSFHIQI